jgi:Domain of unknown function (DUF4406)
LKLYLAGPMRGYPDFNFPLFFKTASTLEGLGHTVFNPASRDVSKYGSEKLKTATGSEEEVSKNLGLNGLQLARDCFLADTAFICTHADGIYLLPGWEKSKGAVAERALCEAIGLKIASSLEELLSFFTVNHKVEGH